MAVLIAITTLSALVAIAFAWRLSRRLAQLEAERNAASAHPPPGQKSGSDADGMTETRHEIDVQRRLLQKVLDALPDPVWLKDREGRYLALNPAAGEWIGGAPETIVGKTDHDFFDRAMADRFLETDRKAEAADVPWRSDGWMTYPDGRRIYFETIKTPIRTEGKLIGILGISHDVTERKQAESILRRDQEDLGKLVATRAAELEAAEEKTRQILESSADGLFGLDAQGVITFVNPAACQMLGRTPDQMIGRPSHALIHHSRADGNPYPPEECPMCTAWHDGCSVRIDGEVFWRGDGTSLPVEYAATPMRKQEHVVGAVVSFHDISRRREAEDSARQALAEATRLARLRSDFIANMSHEIRTPLNAVLGLAQVGLRDSQGRKSQGAFARIEEAGQMLLTVINDILDFSKIEAGKLVVERIPFRLGEVIDRAISLTAARAYEKRLDLTIEESPDLPESCLGDPVRLTQVLVNLIGNAVKFTERGRVALVVRRCLDQESGAPCFAFRVEDTGIGMTAEERARLFRPFEQSDTSTTRIFGGTGLGLTISKRLADMMGGSIHVESQPGAGSVFELRLPLAEVPAAERTLPPENSCPAAVRVCGLGLAETAALTADLRRRGIEVAEAGCARLFEPPLPGALIIDSDMALVPDFLEAAQGAGLDAQDAPHLVIVLTPGDHLEVPDILRRADIAERPLNLRRLQAACHRHSNEPDEPRTQSPFGAGPRLSGFSVLAAEDNLLNQVVLADILAQEGAMLTLAGNGVECLERLQERGADAFDILITDIQMPEMNGYETARRTRALAPNLPIVGLTAHAMPEERQRCLDAGMDEHLAKPFDVDTLVAMILRLAASPRASREGGENPVIAPPPDEATRPHEERTTARPAGAIDWPVLEDRYRGRPEFILRIVYTALASVAQTAAGLREAAARRDHETLASLAHRLKGTAGHLMAHRLLDLSALAEAAAKNHSADAETLAKQLANAVDDVNGELLDYDTH